MNTNQRLDDRDLNDMEGNAKGRAFSNPEDVLRLVEEVRLLRKELAASRNEVLRLTPPHSGI